jgi:hypothetical protein
MYILQENTGLILHMNDNLRAFRRTDYCGRVFAAGAFRPEVKWLIFAFTYQNQ